MDTPAPARTPLAALKRLRAELKERRISRRTRRSPDRVLLTEQILPALARRGGRILWIGCRRYTDDYPALLEREGGECWTLDIDPAAARFGRAGRHVVADLRDAPVHLGELRFSTIVCNGIFGYGLDEPVAQDAAMQAMLELLLPSGLLILGWNTDKIDDPLELSSVSELTRPVAWLDGASRVPISGGTHVYDHLTHRYA